MRRAWLIILCAATLLEGTRARAQDNTMRVEFAAEPAKNTVIGVFRRDGIIYGSAVDVAHVFSLGTYENKPLQKFELTQSSYRMVMTAGSPFVVITDQAGKHTMYQLNGNVIHAAGTYFLPLGAFVRLLNNVFARGILYDEPGRSLRVGTRPSSPRFDVSAPRIEQKANGMLIRIPVAKPVRDLETWLRQDNWLYLTIPDAKGDIAAINATKPLGLVRKIIAIQSPNSLQLTFKLSGAIASSELSRPLDSNDIVLTVRKKTAEDSAEAARSVEALHQGLERERNRWELDAIVLDAGHGGKDWGAIGVSGVREKDVTLGIALKLGRLLEKNLRGVRVVYTRRNDTFIELDRRGQIANEADGKLFVSIHCNSLKRKPSPTRGFEVYLLRPGRTNEAVAIAERENAVIQMEEGYERRYRELTEENFILVTMAQSAHVKASEVFADLAQQEMEQVAGIPNRGVKQAGFYVLVGAAMPNVLVETAYLSNRQDEKYLKSEAGQQNIAESLYRAIKRYKQNYEKLLHEGSEIGQR